MRERLLVVHAERPAGQPVPTVSPGGREGYRWPAAVHYAGRGI